MDKQELLRRVELLEASISSAQPDPLRAGSAARDVATRAPWLLAKLGELTVGVAANALGAGLVEGIKLALTYLPK